MKIVKVLLMILGGFVVLCMGFLWYMGCFDNLKVTEMEMGPYTYAYQSFVGPYQATGPVFEQVKAEVGKAGFHTDQGIGFYYDDPSKIPANKLRSDCGILLRPQDAHSTLAFSKGIKVASIERKRSMVVEFPVKNAFSYMIGPYKGYPALMQHAQQKRYKMTMTYELYIGNKTFYVMEIVK